MQPNRPVRSYVILEERGRQVSVTRRDAALRWYVDALLYGTPEEVAEADAEVDAAIKEELK